jgi:predicted DNA binding CopG/RHH family protein
MVNVKLINQSLYRVKFIVSINLINYQKLIFINLELVLFHWIFSNLLFLQFSEFLEINYVYFSLLISIDSANSMNYQELILIIF